MKSQKDTLASHNTQEANACSSPLLLVFFAPTKQRVEPVWEHLSHVYVDPCSAKVAFIDVPVVIFVRAGSRQMRWKGSFEYPRDPCEPKSVTS